MDMTLTKTFLKMKNLFTALMRTPPATAPVKQLYKDLKRSYRGTSVTVTYLANKYQGQYVKIGARVHFSDSEVIEVRLVPANVFFSMPMEILNVASDFEHFRWRDVGDVLEEIQGERLQWLGCKSPLLGANKKIITAVKPDDNSLIYSISLQ